LSRGAPPGAGGESPIALAVRGDAPDSVVPDALPDDAQEVLRAALDEKDAGLLLVLYIGVKPSTGYRVEIETIGWVEGEDGEALQVTYREQHPDPEGGGAPALTCPYLIVRLPGVDIAPDRVVFIEQ
jgi:hypothetical protein